jgi:hypothetical protein
MLGTSNATALMSRAASQLIPVLDALRASASDGASLPQEVPDTLWIKAYLFMVPVGAVPVVTISTFLRHPKTSNCSKINLAASLVAACWTRIPNVNAQRVA